MPCRFRSFLRRNPLMDLMYARTVGRYCPVSASRSAKQFLMLAPQSQSQSQSQSHGHTQMERTRQDRHIQGHTHLGTIHHPLTPTPTGHLPRQPYPPTIIKVPGIWIHRFSLIAAQGSPLSPNTTSRSRCLHAKSHSGRDTCLVSWLNLSQQQLNETETQSTYLVGIDCCPSEYSPSTSRQLHRHWVFFAERPLRKSLSLSLLQGRTHAGTITPNFAAHSPWPTFHLPFALGARRSSSGVGVGVQPLF